jgi:hypothetical protein
LICPASGSRFRRDRVAVDGLHHQRLRRWRYHMVWPTGRAPAAPLSKRSAAQPLVMLPIRHRLSTYAALQPWVFRRRPAKPNDVVVDLDLDHSGTGPARCRGGLRRRRRAEKTKRWPARLERTFSSSISNKRSLRTSQLPPPARYLVLALSIMSIPSPTAVRTIRIADQDMIRKITAEHRLSLTTGARTFFFTPVGSRVDAHQVPGNDRSRNLQE